MLIVTVELESAVTGKTTLLGKALIYNDGTGTQTRGNYDIRVGRRGQGDPYVIYNRPARSGHVTGHPRLRASVWSLITKALQAARY